ncbi:YybH family protein [Micromonospora sp. NPDC018662]|uniref:YybH family protein n=1 Tax=Micromonospora sp. NPDC018662 TaxID=3364238 RepID=UPI0037932848
MTDDENQIRELVERWVRAVQAGDLAGVLADRADDIVMYDVPPPAAGTRGIEAYERSWPDFLRWQTGGARFELTDLAVVAGGTVAFAYALLRCGTPDELARRPELRLRLTLGLRKRDGRWVVAHEHHSFPVDDGARERAASEREVRAVHRHWFEATAAGDLAGLMRPIAADVVSYEHEQPLEYVGRDRVREICAAGLRVGGDVTWTVPDMTVVVRDDLAVSWGLNRVTARDGQGDVVEVWSRGTRVFRRTAQGWRLTHQHLSFPLDPGTGRARTDLSP